jgi:endo-1,4-beta-D-glucanase Y
VRDEQWLQVRLWNRFNGENIIKNGKINNAIVARGVGSEYGLFIALSLPRSNAQF